ncbi:MAG: hypothetical protein MRERV_88c001, partial [Mycoplasmataceae bacterium RV_VA103A]
QFLLKVERMWMREKVRSGGELGANNFWITSL